MEKLKFQFEHAAANFGLIASPATYLGRKAKLQFEGRAQARNQQDPPVALLDKPISEECPWSTDELMQAYALLFPTGDTTENMSAKLLDIFKNIRLTVRNFSEIESALISCQLLLADSAKGPGAK